MTEISQTWFRLFGCWRQSLADRRLFMAVLTVGGFTALVNLVATLKELVVAHLFGTGDALDALLIALLLPSLASNVIAGSFSGAIVPALVHIRESQDYEGMKRLFSNVMVGGTLLLLFVSLLLALTASLLLGVLGSGFDPEKQALTRSLFFMLLPILLISGLGTVWAAVLNAYERFALAAVAPIMIPLMGIVFLFSMGQVWGVYALAAGTVAGFIAEVALLAWGVRHQGLILLPRWYGFDPVLKRVAKQYVPMVVGALVMSCVGLVDQSMAAMLGPGSVSSLSYGNKIVALILGIGSLSVGTAVFPYFSRLVAVKDWSGLRRTVKGYGILTLLLTVPITFGLIYFSKPLIRVLFERGAFTPADTAVVGDIQIFLLLQIPFYLLSILMVRLFSSLNKNSILMHAAMINLFSKVILNYVLIQWLGVAGIGLSTALVCLISLGYYFAMLNKQIRILGHIWKR
jgi:putative peptidoglycan lipid II flippase